MEPNPAESVLLELQGVHASYGRGQVLAGIDLRIKSGEVVALLGKNGAGKSTILKSVIGLVALSAGTASFEGCRIDGLPPERICRLGIAWVPENRRIFAGLSVEENLRMGFLQAGKLASSEKQSRLRRLFDLYPRLEERRRQDGITLSGGEQQMLAIARALAGRPRLLLLDEPSEGLAPSMVDEIFESIGRMKRDGMAVLLVEQNVGRALGASDRAYLVERGRTEVNGAAADLLADGDVRRRLSV